MDPRRTQNGFSPLIRRIRSRSSRSSFGRPTRLRDFQRQNASKPERCHRKMVSGFTTWDVPSRPGQIRVIQANNARSIPRRRSRCGACLNAQVLGFRRAPRLEQIDDEHPSEFRLQASEFSKDGTKSAGFTPLDNRRPNTRMPARPARAQPAPS